jgi:hypothetical protein
VLGLGVLDGEVIEVVEGEVGERASGEGGGHFGVDE